MAEAMEKFHPEAGSDIQQAQKDEKSLLDVLALYPISHLDNGGLLTLRKLSKQLSTNLSTNIKEQWNVRRGLGRFVRNPIGLCSQMARHGALISGSFAMQFFDDILWKESDLDVYSQNGEAVSAFGPCLLHEERYRFVEESIERDTYAESDTARRTHIRE